MICGLFQNVLYCYVIIMSFEVDEFTILRSMSYKHAFYPLELLNIESIQ